MAIGFLFLQGGRATFSRTKEAKAALLCALHPRAAVAMNDNQYHLQALRHLYTLATERRCLSVRDVDTGEEVYCPVVLESRDPDNQHAFVATRCVAPCILPHFEPDTQLFIDTPRWVGVGVRVFSPPCSLVIAMSV